MCEAETVHIPVNSAPYWHTKSCWHACFVCLFNPCNNCVHARWQIVTNRQHLSHCFHLYIVLAKLTFVIHCKVPRLTLAWENEKSGEKRSTLQALHSNHMPERRVRVPVLTPIVRCKAHHWACFTYSCKYFIMIALICTFVWLRGRVCVQRLK